MFCFMGTNRTRTLRRRPQTVLSWHSPSRARLALCYGFLQGAWPFGLVEAIWASAAVYHWRQRAKHAQRPARRKCPVDVIGDPVREVVQIAGCQESAARTSRVSRGAISNWSCRSAFLERMPRQTRHLHAHAVNRSVYGEKQRLHVRSAKGEIGRHFGRLDRADMGAVRRV